jgi:tetratricopeptide (TPR) repeat protein
MGDSKHNMGDEMGALPYYQRAVELDPMFAMAYARLGAVYNNLQQTQLSETNRQKAFELRDRASEREKLYITSHYYADSGQLDKGIAALELYQQTYPRDAIPFINLANIYNGLGQYDKALPMAKHAVELAPDGLSAYENLALAYIGLNRIDEARATLNSAHQIKAGAVSLMIASLDWAQGKDSEIEKSLQSAGSTPDGEVGVLNFRVGMAASHGQVRMARDFARKTQEALDRLHLQGRADVDVQLAGFEAIIGNPQEAIRRVNEATRTSRTFNVLWGSGIALAAAGQDQKALSFASEIQRSRPNDTIAQNVAVPMTQAVVTLNPSGSAKPQPEKAIDLLNTSALYMRSSSGVLYARGLAYKQAGRYDEAVQDFQKLLDWKPLHGPDYMVSAAQLELGRVYQKQGDTAKARIAYQNFLAMWKDADPDVPLLLQAKAEYAKLQ